jgi:hypothetical protein
MATMVWAGQPRNRDSISNNSKIFPLLQVIHINFCVHLASYSIIIQFVALSRRQGGRCVKLNTHLRLAPKAIMRASLLIPYKLSRRAEVLQHLNLHTEFHTVDTVHLGHIKLGYTPTDAH